MSRAFVAALSVVLLMLMTVSTVLAGPKFESLEELWNEHMLVGTGGHYSGGDRSGYQTSKGYETAAGAGASARGTNRGIAVSDLSGVRFLGLVQGVGWTLDGGLLGRARVNGDFLEVYGRWVVYRSGGFFGLDTYAKHKGHRYQFFLLHRPVGAARVTILQKWSLPPEDINWFLPFLFLPPCNMNPAACGLTPPPLQL